MRSFLAAAVLSAVAAPEALPADPNPAALRAKNSHVFALDEGSLSGPGWELLRSATANTPVRAPRRRPRRQA